MDKAKENIGKTLNSLLLIAALAFLFLARGEKVSSNTRSGSELTAKIEFKANAQAIPIVATAVPSIDWFSVFTASKPRLSFPEYSRITSYNQNITESLNVCTITFLCVKPLLLKPLQKQILPRNSDPDAALLG